MRCHHQCTAIARIYPVHLMAPGWRGGTNPQTKPTGWKSFYWLMPSNHHCHLLLLVSEKGDTPVSCHGGYRPRPAVRVCSPCWRQYITVVVTTKSQWWDLVLESLLWPAMTATNYSHIRSKHNTEILNILSHQQVVCMLQALKFTLYLKLHAAVLIIFICNYHNSIYSAIYL